MPRYSVPHDVLAELKQNCEVVRKPKHTILFKRGQAAFGMFLVMRGKVALDFGVDGSCSLNGAYGPGALVGLPATLTGRTYSMTATVTDNAELGFISSKDLKGILRQQPELCRQLLNILSAKITHTYQITKSHLDPSEVGMAWLKHLLQKLNSEEGQDIAEYAVMLAVILVIVVATIRLVGFQREQRIFASS